MSASSRLSVNPKMYQKLLYWNGWRINWPVVLAFIFIHSGCVYGLYLMVFTHIKWSTLMWHNFIHLVAAPGITAGAHRLWSHRSFKAKWPLRLFLAIAQTMSLQRDIYEWSADHRIHHKYSETDADPHNAKRGFFYSHIGWIMIEKHPEAVKKMETIDLSDLLDDPIVYYQRKYYIAAVLTFWFAIPVLVPCYFWNESFLVSFFLNVTRYVFMLHCAFFVNSVAHLWGIRPYDKNINPAESNAVTWLTIGEGYHNYHHVFPYDYSTGEYSWELLLDMSNWSLPIYARGNAPIGGLTNPVSYYLENFNITTLLIEYCARKGWAYDLKRATPTTVHETRVRKGLAVDTRPTNVILDYVYGLGVQTWITWFPLICRLFI